MMRRLLKTAACASAALAVVMAPAGAAVAESIQATIAKALMHQAQFWRARGRADVAQQALRRALKADPDNAAVQRELAQIPAAERAARARAAGFQALDAGRTDEAEALFAAALKLSPRDPDAAGGLGVLRLRAGRFEEARALLAPAAAADPAKWSASLDSASFYGDLRKAEAARDAGDLDQARAVAERLATAQIADRALAQTLLADVGRRQAAAVEAAALAAWKSGDPATADRAYRQAVAFAPEAPWTRYRYARFLRSRGDKAAAEALMAPLVRAGAAEGLFAAALFLDGEGRGGEAAELLDRIAPADRTPAMESFARALKCEFAVRAARSLQALGRSEDAAAGLRRLAEEPGLSAGGLAQLADGLFAVGDAPAARRLVDRSLALPLEAPEDYEGDVSVLARNGEDAAAGDLIRRLAARADDPAAHAEIARLQARQALGSADRRSRQGDVQGAIVILRAQLAATPSDPELLSALGFAYLARRRGVEAQPIFERLTAEHPNDEAAWLGLAAAATQGGQFVTADAALGHSRRLAGADPQVALASARLEQARGEGPQALKQLRQALVLRQTLVAADPFAALSPAVAMRVRASFEATAPAAAVRDPAGDSLRRDVETAEEAVSPRLEARAEHRAHTGEPGLSRLRLETASLAASSFLLNGRLEAKVRLVDIEAGHLRPGDRARFGAGPLAASLPAPRGHAAGTEVSLAYEAGDVRAELGTTPIGFGATTVQGEASWSPKPAPDLQARFWVERRPLTDSLTAYAGAEDRASGLAWGQVARTGAGAALTLIRADAGVYADLAAYGYDGRRVRGNRSGKLDLGGYAKIAGRGERRLTAGVNLDVQAFARNENAFLFGHGGYFSPQQFLSLALPLRYVDRHGPWRVDLQASPGWQTYREGDAPAFPTDPARQAALAPAARVLSGGSKRGIGATGRLAIDYAVGPRLLLGGEAGADTFGAYKETHLGLRLRLRFDGAAP